MSQIYMMTMPRLTTCKREIKIMMNELDVKKYVIARETGRSGYKHWQCRMELSGDLGQWVKRNGLTWHVETANDVWDYEQKDGDYWTSSDTLETRRIRNGKLSRVQMEILGSVDRQTDRMVTIWIDPHGGTGKTFAFIRGVLGGEVLPVPATGINPTRLSGWLYSAYRGQRIIWIDIPKGHKVDDFLWENIEEAKNIIYEWRYSSRWQVISGVKILVTTNSYISKKHYAMLSADRWDVHNVQEIYGKMYREYVEGLYKIKLLPMGSGTCCSPPGAPPRGKPLRDH